MKDVIRLCDCTRHRHSSKEREEPAKEHRKGQARERIEWRGEDGLEPRRSSERDKRPRESPGRAERRHTIRHDRVSSKVQTMLKRRCTK